MNAASREGKWEIHVCVRRPDDEMISKNIPL